MNAAGSLQAALDPILVDFGFAAGQAGDGDDSDIIWCAAYTEFQRRFPWLPQAREHDDVGNHACVDLTVRQQRGRVAEVDLEAHSVADTFIALDRPAEAARVTDLLGSQAQVVGTALAPLLATLFESPPGAR